MKEFRSNTIFVLVVVLIVVALRFGVRAGSATGTMKGNFYVRSESGGYVCAADDSAADTMKLTYPLSRDAASAVCDRLNAAAPADVTRKDVKEHYD